MSFFNTSDGQAIEANTEFDSGGDIEPIPAKTRLKALIQDAKYDEYEGERYINITWSVLEPENYKNRKVFQKVKVFNGDAKKTDKAKRMLAAIDANAGGGLMKLGRIPTDADLQINLLNKIMLIQVMIWESEDKSRSGNWVNAVSSGKEQPVTASVTDGDDIPF